MTEDQKKIKKLEDIVKKLINENRRMNDAIARERRRHKGTEAKLETLTRAVDRIARSS